VGYDQSVSGITSSADNKEQKLSPGQISGIKRKARFEAFMEALWPQIQELYYIKQMALIEVVDELHRQGHLKLSYSRLHKWLKRKHLMQPKKIKVIQCGVPWCGKMFHPTSSTQKRCNVCAPDGAANNRWNKYQMTQPQFDEFLVKQSGLCIGCLRTLTPGVMGKGLPHVDHCHITGRVRGILCMSCNTVLGQLQDDPSRLRRLATYIEKNR